MNCVYPANFGGTVYFYGERILPVLAVMAIVVIWGLILTIFLALVVVPTFYPLHAILTVGFHTSDD